MDFKGGNYIEYLNSQDNGNSYSLENGRIVVISWRDEPKKNSFLKRLFNLN